MYNSVRFCPSVPVLSLSFYRKDRYTEPCQKPPGSEQNTGRSESRARPARELGADGRKNEEGKRT